LALGMVKASGCPAAVCVTSGSALANLAPALAEARASGLPLLALAADRPWELHGVSAPQTMAQRGALSAFVVEEPVVGEPLADDLALRALRARVSRAAQAQGPVLINVPLREPLISAPGSLWTPPAALSSEALDGRPARRPYTFVGRTSRQISPLSSEPGEAVLGIDWLRPGLRGIIFAGPGPIIAEMSAGALSQATGYPLVADASSGERLWMGAEVVTTGDALLAGPLGDERPDVIIACTAIPLSRTVFEWIDRQRCPLLTIGDAASIDFLGRAWASLPHLHSDASAELLEMCRSGDAAWRERWLAAERLALIRLRDAMAVEPWGEVLAAHLAFAHRPPAIVHAASSMSVRHANLHARGNVLANRGINGIDGTIGTFLGEVLGSGMPGRLVCGDLAFLHDLPALAAAAPAAGSAIVVLNNDGGGIFDFLPVARMPEYQTWVRTPHGRNCAGAAALFGLGYRLVSSRVEMMEALDAAAVGSTAMIIECAVPGNAVERHRALLRALATP
ncbi:MAG: hypothetical protein H0W72_18110, partial [Planctomycetes bacterium]|nr:hypothetical protein [Planctomycetota bacterium]